MRSKLTWMYIERKVVPEDHIIHHGPLGRYCDSYFNLECMSYADHQEHHYGPDDSF
jgi:hypothetical protein